MDEIKGELQGLYIHKDWTEIFLGGDVSEPKIKPAEGVRAALVHPSKILVLNFSKTTTIHPQGLLWIEQLVAYADTRGVRVRAYVPKNKRIGRLLKLMRYDRFLLISNVLEDLLDPGLIYKVAFPDDKIMK